METVRVVQKVMEYMEKEAKEIEERITPINNRGVDVLTKALGIKDHRGFVKTLGRSGVGIGHQLAFGKVDGKAKRSIVNEEVEEAKASIRDEFEKAFEERVQERVAIKVQAYLKSLSTLKMPTTQLDQLDQTISPFVNKKLHQQLRM